MDNRLLEALRTVTDHLEKIYRANKENLSLGDIEILDQARAILREVEGESDER